jgi:heme/copper-type cytochrome/quinol oxidase subunit 3
MADAEAMLHDIRPTTLRTDAEGHVRVPVSNYKFGMWLFLTSEVMFFSGIIGAYLVLRLSDPAGFSEQAHHLNWVPAAINTIVLISSSLTMALAIHWAQEGRVASVKLNLLITILCGLIFMGIKAIEYNAKFSHVPPITPSTHVFWASYFTATGLHGVHVVAGVIPLIYFFFRVSTAKDVRQWAGSLECMGLYWHLVDLVWIFLFPLYYLLH